MIDGAFLKRVEGKKLAGVYLHKNKQEMILTFDDGTAQSFVTEADCCSSTWIENVTFDGEVLYQPIVRIEEKDLPNVKECDEEHDQYDSYSLVQAYSTVFVTPRGRLEIEYRNESNGYYGGSLEDGGTVRVQLLDYIKVDGDL